MMTVSNGRKRRANHVMLAPIDGHLMNSETFPGESAIEDALEREKINENSAS